MAERKTSSLKRKIREEDLRWHRLILLHRECVRRNEDYAKQYNEFQEVAQEVRPAWRLALEEHWGLWTCEELPDPRARPDLRQLTKSIPSFKDLRRYNEFDDPLEASAEAWLLSRLLHKANVATFMKALKGFAFFLYFPEQPGSRLRYAAIDMRRSQKELRDFLQDLLQEVIASRRKHHLKQVSPPTRLRSEEMFNYLRAYDLKQEDLEYEDITRELWPDQVKSNSAWEYVNKATKLIRKPPLTALLKKYLQKRSECRTLSLNDFNPPIVVPKTRARLRGQNYEGQLRWRLGPLLVRALPRTSSADHQKPKTKC